MPVMNNWWRSWIGWWRCLIASAIRRPSSRYWNGRCLGSRLGSSRALIAIMATSWLTSRLWSRLPSRPSFHCVLGCWFWPTWKPTCKATWKVTPALSGFHLFDLFQAQFFLWCVGVFESMNLIGLVSWRDSKVHSRANFASASSHVSVPTGSVFQFSSSSSSSPFPPPTPPTRTLNWSTSLTFIYCGDNNKRQDWHDKKQIRR